MAGGGVPTGGKNSTREVEMSRERIYVSRSEVLPEGKDTEVGGQRIYLGRGRETRRSKTETGNLNKESTTVLWKEIGRIFLGCKTKLNGRELQR